MLAQLAGEAGLTGASQIVDAPTMDVAGGVEVAVQDRTTLRTDPGTVLQNQALIYETAMTAGLARSIETIDLMNNDAILRSNMLQTLHEPAKGEVVNLPSPEATHAAHVQVLDANDVVLSAEPMRELPLPVRTAVRDTLMEPVQLRLPAVPMTAVLHAAAQAAGC